MALHFTLVGEDEFSIHFDIDGIVIAGTGGSPGAPGKVTVNFLNPPPPSGTH